MADTGEPSFEPAMAETPDVPDAPDGAGANPAAESPPAAPRRRRRWLRRVLLLIGPLAVVVVGGYFYVTGGRWVSTENAYVKAHKVAISAQVAGKIVEVAVHENQHVDKGALLFRIDDRSYRVALDRAEAQVRAAANDIRRLKASYRQNVEQLKLARDNEAYADRAYHRQLTLAAKQFASDSKLDQVRHDLTVARMQIAVLEQALAQIRARLGGDPDLPVERYAAYRAAVAARDVARLDLKRTAVHAPFAGVASNVPNIGQYVSPAAAMLPGAAVMAVVADRDVWIEANFKETALTHVRRGQRVDIGIDTYPSHHWHGVVQSISPATGAEFSVIPPQNATGNWVKVVQRIPVRIAVEVAPGDPPLRAGMSATVDIDTHHRRPLPKVLRHVLAWLGVLQSPVNPQRAMSAE